MIMRGAVRRTSLLFGAALILAPLATAGAEEKESSSEASEALIEETRASAGREASEQDPGRAGLTAHIDPETGELTETPTREQREQLLLSPELDNALSVSTDGLEQVFLPNGGVMVDLQGRFRSAVFATVAADGTVTLGHGVLAPSSQDESENEGPTAGSSR